jgi:hypothetical protein
MSTTGAIDLSESTDVQHGTTIHLSTLAHVTLYLHVVSQLPSPVSRAPS